MRERLAEERRAFLARLAAATRPGEIEALRKDYLGPKGRVREILKQVASIPAEDRPAAGQAANAWKREVEEALDRATPQAEPEPDREPIDVTLPSRPPLPGRFHPIRQTLVEIEEVFARLGFQVVHGPEIETRENNFDALNIPSDHPSADPFDTFFLDDRRLLRSHTSPVQIRAMRERRPPLRVIAPGRVFRPDTADACHLPQFHQVEGLMVGEDVSFAHLKTTLMLFARIMFGLETRVQFRPSFFPFTEPSADVEVSCLVCGGKGCAACKNSGWLEILGAGMVHPNVFRAVGYDPERWTGFAFGMGVERIAMLRHRVGDIRWFVENHFAFLRRFPP